MEKARYFELIDVVNKLRSLITSHHDSILKAEDHAVLLEALSPYSDIETVQVFLSDCDRCVGGAFDFTDTRDFTFSKKERLVLSFFKAPYNAAYGLDAFVYEIEEPEAFFREKFATSKATSINILKCTEGFDQYPTCVALFPENFCSAQSFADGFSVFYFVNVFERRFQEYGKPTLDSFVHKNSFWRLKRLSKKFRAKAFATWHYLHEHFHSTGDLPIVDYLKIKSTRSSAAIEESKVDALSILECLKSADEGFQDGLMYAELILFERLIRYSIHENPNENYDAKSSYLLFGFLQQAGVLSVDNLVLNFDRKAIRQALQEYVRAIEQIEREIRQVLDQSPTQDYKKIRAGLSLFAKTHVSQGLELKNEYFENVRATIEGR